MTNWIDPKTSTAMSDQKISMVGTGGRIICDQKNRGVQIVTEDNGVEDINPYFNLSISNNHFDGATNTGYGVRNIIQFIKDVNDINCSLKTLDYFEKFRPTFKNSMVSTIILESLQESLINNSKKINIPKW